MKRKNQRARKNLRNRRKKTKRRVVKKTSTKTSRGNDKSSHGKSPGKRHKKRPKPSYITAKEFDSRIYGGKMLAREWSPEDVNWCRDNKFKSIVFVDECVVRTGVSLKRLRSILGESCRVLTFPVKYILTGRKDPEVLMSILEFVSENHILLDRKLKLGLVTFDHNFAEDSESDQQFEKFGFKIKFLILNLSDLVALELQRLINQKTP